MYAGVLSSSGPFMVSAGPDGCMRSTCMYVLMSAHSCLLVEYVAVVVDYSSL